MSPRRTDETATRESSTGVAVRYGALELAAKGSQAIYVVGLVIVMIMAARGIGPVLTALHEIAVAMHDTSATLREVAENARAARAGVDELRAARVVSDSHLSQVLSEIHSLRAAVEKPCKRFP